MTKIAKTPKTPKTGKTNAKTPNTEKINLEKFREILESKPDLKEKKTRETIYIYPDTMASSDINSEKGKKFRNAIRNGLKRHANNIWSFAKTKDLGKLQAEIELFEVFYKEKFKLNDLSLASLTQTTNEVKVKDIATMIDIIKEVKGGI